MSRRTRKPVDLMRAHEGRGGSTKVETAASTWGVMPRGFSDELPGVILTVTHPDDPHDVAIGLEADDVDELIGSLIEARAVLTKRYGIAKGRFG